jgi:hypothetical protein
LGKSIREPLSPLPDATRKQWFLPSPRFASFLRKKEAAAGVNAGDFILIRLEDQEARSYEPRHGYWQTMGFNLLQNANQRLAASDVFQTL